MGVTKTELFSQKQNEVAQVIKALAHPARIAIVEFLLLNESCICGDIVNQVQLSQPTVSQHLKELKSAGIIKGNVEGNSICYCLNEKTMQNLSEYFNAISNKLKHTSNQCC